MRGGLGRGSTWRGLTLEEDVGLEVVSRLRNMEVRRARGAARKRWLDDGLGRRFTGHGSCWWCREDVKVRGVGHGAKHGLE